jgi:hypothetical protein
LRKNLAPNETVLAYARGLQGALLVATDRRALIIKTGYALGTWFGRQTTSFGYGQITSVEMRSGVGRGFVEISAGGMQNRPRGYFGRLRGENIVAFNKWSEAGLRDVVNVIRQHLYAPPPHVAAPVGYAPHQPQNIPDQIAALAKLRDAGVLTVAEFEAKKTDLLNRM